MSFFCQRTCRTTTIKALNIGSEAAKLRSEPALIKTTIKELVRFVCPIEMATERYAREDITIAETTIPRGELVMAQKWNLGIIIQQIL
jgi:cytochrome P450 PksS